MVKLTRIYTRTGDDGSTRLSDLSSVRKTDPRVDAYGIVDEANCVLGLVATEPGLQPDVADVVRHIQNELFDVGADLSFPLDATSAGEPLRVTADYVTRVEAWCDAFGADLPSLRSFVLPGGTRANALLHLARTVVRRAERAAWRANETTPVNPDAITYLNRLSDLFFILARYVAEDTGEVLWVPGKDRDPNRG